jgi:hypothetical protein
MEMAPVAPYGEKSLDDIHKEPFFNSPFHLTACLYGNTLFF